MNQEGIKLYQTIHDFRTAIKLLEEKQPANHEAIERLKSTHYELLEAFYVINKPESQSIKKEKQAEVWQQYVELWDDTVKKGPEVQRTVPTKDIAKVVTKDSLLTVILFNGIQYRCNFMEFK